MPPNTHHTTASASASPSDAYFGQRNADEEARDRLRPNYSVDGGPTQLPFDFGEPEIRRSGPTRHQPFRPARTVTFAFVSEMDPTQAISLRSGSVA